jgi:predicted TIM-barrel fold metal-dependent hydrolase
MRGPIIDSHIHLYPDEAAADPAAWAGARAEPAWLACVAPEEGPRLQGWATVETLIRDLDRAGVDRAIIQGWYWENQETCREHNAFMAEAVRAHPQRLSAFASIAVGGLEPSGVEKAASAAREAGFAGFGELHSGVQGFGPGHAAFEQLATLAGEWEMPLLLHVTEGVGRRYPGRRETPLEALVAMTTAHPRTTFILAHFGGLLPFFELNPFVRAQLGNVYYDTAASPLLYLPRVYRLACEAVGATKLLFGTDYPLRVFPRRQRRPSFHLALEEIRSAGLTEEAQRWILGGNARRLLNLP